MGWSKDYLIMKKMRENTNPTTSASTHPHWLGKCCKAGLEVDLPTRSDHNQAMDSNTKAFYQVVMFLG